MTGSEASPGWRRAFLRELARSGSVVRAAERGGIDKSSAYQLRRRNAAFAASWDRAQAVARDRLGAAAGGEAAGGEAGGEVVREGRAGQAEMLRLAGDETVRASRAGRPCIARVGPGRWSAASEEAFLAKLAATCNITAAAKAAGFSTSAAYARRRKWPAFAAAWAEAVAEGYDRLELLMIEAATTTLAPPAAAARGSAPWPEPPAMTIDQITKLLHTHRASQRGGAPQRYGWRGQDPPIAEVHAEILRKVAAIERARDGASGGEQREG